MLDKINKKLNNDNNTNKSELRKYAEGCSKKAGGSALLFASVVGLLIGFSDIGGGNKNNDKRRNH
jgi:hypothetical protein